MSDEDLEWAVQKFENDLGEDALPPLDPEGRAAWEDWRSAWSIIRDRVTDTGGGLMEDDPADIEAWPDGVMADELDEHADAIEAEFGYFSDVTCVREAADRLRDRAAIIRSLVWSVEWAEDTGQKVPTIVSIVADQARYLRDGNHFKSGRPDSPPRPTRDQRDRA